MKIPQIIIGATDAERNNKKVLRNLHNKEKCQFVLTGNVMSYPGSAAVKLTCVLRDCPDFTRVASDSSARVGYSL
jgi:hypothetical protein